MTTTFLQFLHIYDYTTLKIIESQSGPTLGVGLRFTITFQRTYTTLRPCGVVDQAGDEGLVDGGRDPGENGHQRGDNT